MCIRDSSKGEPQAYISLGVFLLLVFTQSINGMESALLVFALIILYSASIKYYRRYFLIGILAGVLVLARLDFFILIFTWLIVQLIRKDWKSCFLISTGFLLLLLPYVLSNYLSTGYFQPITGILKSSFPDININFDLQFTFTALISIFTALAASVIYFIFFLRNADIRSNKNPFIFILSFTVILHFLFYILFTKWEVLNYYFLFYGVFVSLISAEFINLKKIKLIIPVFISASVIFVLLKIISHVDKNIESSWHAEAYNAAIWARGNTSPDEIFAMRDAGNFAYFSERRVINLDGIVNDYCYQEFLRKNKLNLYLRKNNVSYYVLYESSASPGLWKGEYDKYEEVFTSYMYMTASDKIAMAKENEVYRKSFNGNKNSVFIIWKMK